MGEHFVLLVDHLLTESTLEAALESRNLKKQSAALAHEEVKIECTSHDRNSRSCSSPKKMAECRICQDEDEDTNMETPCCCRGSLKYAHRRCIQRWCNEKGDTMCEICHQQFKPGYTAPNPLCQIGGMPMDFRGNWGIARRDLNNLRIISMVSTDRSFVDPNYNDHAAPTLRSLFWCRSVAVIFMLLLILRHTLPVIVSGAEEYSLSLFSLLLLRTFGIVLPIYVMLKAVSAIQHRQRQLSSPSMSDTSSDEETG
ncbi:Ubiquitin--protein ligase [Bertholletia excelsa]